MNRTAGSAATARGVLLLGLAIAPVVSGCSGAPVATRPSTPAVAGTLAPTAPASQVPTAGPITCGDGAPYRGRIVFTIGDGHVNGIATLEANGAGYAVVVDPRQVAGQPHGGTEAPTWIGPGRILFDSNRSGGPDSWHLFTVEPGDEPTQITGGEDGIEYHGALAPDGTLLAYAKAVATKDPASPFVDAGLFLARPDGDHEHQLTTVPSGGVDEWPDFSPDGRRIAFSRANAGGEGGIFVIGTDGTGLTRVVPDDLQPIRPRWSPDGQWIAFSTNADRFQEASANVWVVRADGTGLRQVTFESGTGQAYYPAWSPHGEVLLFVHHRPGAAANDLAAVPVVGGDPCTIWSGTRSAMPFEGDWQSVAGEG